MFIFGSQCWCCWADRRCCVGSVDSNSTTERVRKATAVGGCESSPQTAISGNYLRLRRRSVARSSGGPDQTGCCRDISGGRVVADGGWSVSRALECACISSWHGANRIRLATGAALGGLGSARGLPVGCRQHIDYLCDSRCRAEHRVSAVEYE